MLGPPVCIKCMKILSYYSEGDAPGNHNYWHCDGCGIDPNDDGCSHLFLLSEKDLDIILKDAPEIRQIMRNLRGDSKIK